MLHSQRRNILYFDFAMVPYPHDARPIPLRELIPGLKKLVDDGEAYSLRDNERRVLQISKMVKRKAKGGEETVVLLVSFGDRDKPDPGFHHFKTRKLRIVSKTADEGGALSAHII